MKGIESSQTFLRTIYDCFNDSKMLMIWCETLFSSELQWGELRWTFAHRLSAWSYLWNIQILETSPVSLFKMHTQFLGFLSHRENPLNEWNNLNCKPYLTSLASKLDIPKAQCILSDSRNCSKNKLTFPTVLTWLSNLIIFCQQILIQFCIPEKME